MRFQRVLFIIPDLKWHFGYPSCPHTGVGYLAELLEEHGVRYNVLDMTLGYKLTHLRKKIQEFNPDLIGITIYTYRYSDAYQLISQVKQITDKPVVIGGPHVSLWREKALEENLADFAIKNEGEYPFLELCLGKPFEEIDNLIYYNRANIKENPNRSFVKNLDDFPFPKYNHFEMDKYRMIGIVSSRGCPQRCTYCAVKTMMGRGFRQRSPQNVVSELKYWYQKGYRRFEFCDDTFNISMKRIYEICDLVEKEELTDMILGCSGMQLDRVNRPLLKKMKETGFQSLQFGIESASNEILQSIKKNETMEQMEEGVKIACELGYEVFLFFMIGFPGESLADVQKSFEFSLKYPIVAANFYNIIPYPGTELFDYLQKNNLFLIDPKVYLNNVTTRNMRPLFRTASMTMAERKKALLLGQKVWRKTRQNHIERSLKKFGFLGKAFAWFTCIKLIFSVKAWLDHFRLFNKVRCRSITLLGLRKDVYVKL